MIIAYVTRSKNPSALIKKLLEMGGVVREDCSYKEKFVYVYRWNSGFEVFTATRDYQHSPWERVSEDDLIPLLQLQLL